jgi:hypothetical protein
MSFYVHGWDIHALCGELAGQAKPRRLAGQASCGLLSAW